MSCIAVIQYIEESYQMNKLKRTWRFATVIVLLIAIAMAVSCSNRGSKNDDFHDNNKIKIFTFRNNKLLAEAIRQYDRTYSDIEIEAVNFDNLDEYKKRLSSEVLAGKGPDIIYFNSFTIGSIYKILENGVFHDLQPMIDEDLSFDTSKFNAHVFDCGIYKGKRYFIPVSYSVPVFLSSSEILHNSNVNLDIGYFSQEQFMELADAFISSAGSKKDKYLFSHDIDLCEFILSSGLEFFNYEQMKVNVSTPEFKEVVNNYFRLFDYFCPNDVRQKYKEQGYGMLKSGDCLFLNDKSTLLNTHEIGVYTSYFKTLLSQEPQLFSFATYNGANEYIAIAEDCIAINANSKNKHSAYNFIKTILSEPVQSHYSLNCLPVNNNALNYNLEKQKESTNEKFIYNGIDVIMQPLPEEFEQKLKSTIESIVDCEIIDYEIKTLMYASLLPYFEGKRSIEKCLNDMEDKLLLFLNE